MDHIWLTTSNAKQKGIIKPINQVSRMDEVCGYFIAGFISNFMMQQSLSQSSFNLNSFGCGEIIQDLISVHSQKIKIPGYDETHCYYTYRGGKYLRKAAHAKW